mmetsp:Transcript_845/g.1645  ORF Transcript_845/g.1645 Transcript_845/m.1645 type:complete len:678 (-) Transcript_845:157-2190(-)
MPFEKGLFVLLTCCNLGRAVRTSSSLPPLEQAAGLRALEQDAGIRARWVQAAAQAEARIGNIWSSIAANKDKFIDGLRDLSNHSMSDGAGYILGPAKRGAAYSSSLEFPPDYLEGRTSMFQEHKDFWGKKRDKLTWSTDKFVGSETSAMKLILSSSLFSEEAAAEQLKPILKEMLGNRAGLKAVWIHDARAGWKSHEIAPVWKMDTVSEKAEFESIGVSIHVGLWLNRWLEDCETPNCNPMTISEDFGWGFVADRGRRSVSIEEVRKHITDADMLYLPGGNPYTLMSLLQNHPGNAVWETALDRIRKGKLVFVARSAGTIAAGKTADMSSDGRPLNVSTDGFDLLPEQVAFRPHWKETTDHGRRWRDIHRWKKEKWSYADFMANLLDEHKGVRGIRMRDGECITYHQGRISFMRGLPSDDEVDVFMPEYPGKFKWLNHDGQQNLDCGIKSEQFSGRMLITSSMFDVNPEMMSAAVAALEPPSGRALWIGDATVGKRPYTARFQYWYNAKRAFQKHAGIELERVLLGQLPKGQSMENLLKGVGVVYLEGGDHMHLMYAIRKSGILRPLRRRINSGLTVLVTRSAGSIDAGYDVGFTLEKQSEAELDGDLFGMRLLGYCSLRQHFQEPQWHENGKQNTLSKVFIEEAEAQHQRTKGLARLITLRDGEALLVKGSEVTVV